MNNKIIGYVIVSSQTMDDLEEQVTDKIHEEWIPQGGIAISKGIIQNKEVNIYYQSMIKKH